MARKSRKKPLAENTADPIAPIIIEETVQRMAAAAYARLSVEKEGDGSIQTQIELLHQFIADRPELRLADTYVDNGFSGTDFERPDFMRMMDDVRTGKIQCIVVKDLSRFGRDFLETGYYIETLLPRLNVRLIAVNDDFDSFREEDVNNIAVPIKNMVNEMYAKDFSRKVSAYHELHRRNGDMKLTRTAYGYLIDRENNIYVPNPDTAPVVKMIFRWFLMGVRTGQIAERLNLMEIMTPQQYKTAVEWGQPMDKEDRWNMARVRDILRNQRYIGDLVWGKRRKALYQNVPEHKTPREEWTVWHDRHEPLVTKQDFETAQAMLDETADKLSEKPVYQTDTVDCFPGKIYCAECGKRMRYQKLCYQDRNGSIYYCSKENGEGWHQQVHADFLKLFAADQMQLLIQWMCDRKTMIDKVKCSSRGTENLFAAKRKAAKLRMELERTESQLETLYEHLADGILTAEDYQELRKHYAGEKERLLSKMQEAEQEQRYADMQVGRFLDWQAKLEQHLGNPAFSQKLADQLIDRIIVSGSGKIEIVFTCDDVCSQIAELLEGSEAE